MIGLIAVQNEAKPLLEMMAVETPQTHLQARFHRGHLAGHAIVLAEVIPGKVQTAAATQHLIDRYRVDLMMSCGSAGALAPHIQMGDVILADEITLHDFGLQTRAGFHPLGFYDHDHPDGLHYHRTLKADPALLTAAQQAANTVVWPKHTPQIKIGCLASGDQVIADAATKQWLYDTFQALAVEMESGAMAFVAHLNNVPWLAVRSISDQANSIPDSNLLDFITYSDEKPNPLTRLQKKGRTAAKLIQKPARITSMVKLRQAIQQAAANAAAVTTAIIAQLE